MEKKSILVVSLALILLPLSQGLFVPVTAKPLCIVVEADPGKEVIFSYDVTGNAPENLKATF